MEDKVITTVNKSLIDDGTLAGMLAKSSWGDSAVYGSWSERETVFPYIVLDWNFYKSDHWAKFDGDLTIDIFTNGPSTIVAENIQNRIIEILDKQFFESEESGLIRIYLNNITNVPGEKEVVQISINFSILFWRKDFISKL